MVVKKQSTTATAYEGNVGTGSTPIISIVQIELLPSLSFDADWLQIQLSGVGQCKIHSIERQIRTKKGELLMAEVLVDMNLAGFNNDFFEMETAVKQKTLTWLLSH